jgi:UDP-glucuronate 4-epimerase
MRTILITGCAGFIGFHTSWRLLRSGDRVIGFDNLNQFYDEGLKTERLRVLLGHDKFQFIQGDLSDLENVKKLFREHEFDLVVHLAAQAGVRFSLENPHLYVDSNLKGFVNIMEEVRHSRSHFLFASSSSVYGSNEKIPFTENDNVDHPISLYAATKKSNELIAHVYAHLYGLQVTGLRFFTVYGPWGRPDMAMFKFCRSILQETPIQVFNNGRMQRDFTYIDDVVEAISKIAETPHRPRLERQSTDTAPSYRIYNIGNNRPLELMTLIGILEKKLGKTAKLELLSLQPGDVAVTYAAIEKLRRDTGYSPSTPIEEGVSRFVDWYRSYYRI